MTGPLTLTPEEEAALLTLLGNLPLNGSDTGPVARPMIRLLWHLELREATRLVLDGETIH